MTTSNEELISLLVAKELEIKQMLLYIEQLETNYNDLATKYNTLSDKYYSRTNNTGKTIGYKQKGAK